MTLCQLGLLLGKEFTKRVPSSFSPSSSSFHHWNTIQGSRIWMSSSASPLAAGNDDKKEGKTFGEMLENFDDDVLFDRGTPVDDKSLTDVQRAERRALLAFQNYRPGSRADLKLHKFPEFRGEDKDEVYGIGGFGGEVDYSVDHDDNSDVEGDIVRKALDRFESPKDGTLYNEHFRRFDRGYPRFDGYWERKRQVKQAEADGFVVDDISKFMAKVLVDAHSVDSSSLLQKQYIQSEVNAFAQKLREGKDAKLPKEAEAYMVETYGKDWRENKEEWGDGITLTDWDDFELLRTKQHGQYSKNSLKGDPHEDIALVEEMNEMFKNFPFRLEDGEGIESLLYFHPQFESMGDGGRQFYHHEPPSRIEWIDSQLNTARRGRMSRLGSEGGLVGALGDTPDTFDSVAGEEGYANPAEEQGEGNFYVEDENFDEYNEKPMNAEGGAAEEASSPAPFAEEDPAERDPAERDPAERDPAERDPADFDFFRRGGDESAMNVLLAHDGALEEMGSRFAEKRRGDWEEEERDAAAGDERDLDEGAMADNWGSGRMGSNEQTGEDDWAEGKKRPNVSILKLIWGGYGPSWEDMQLRIEKQAEYFRDPSLHGRVSVKTKREIYSLYSRNPLMWSVNKLSRKFGLRKIRIQAIIDMFSQEAKEDKEFGDGWSNIHDDNGNTIDLETELQAMFPNYVADRIDDRWLLRHHTDGLVATSTIDDQVDLHKYTKDYRKAKRNPGRRKWFSNRRLPIPEEELPDHILVPPEFKMTFKFKKHFKEEIVLIDESPEYEDHQRPMFIVKQDGTVWTVPWKMRRQYLIAKSPLPRTALGMHKEMQFNIDLPAPFDADGMKPELGQDIYGIEYQQQAVTTEHDRRCTSFEELAQEDLEDEEYNQDLIRDINEQIMEMEHGGDIYRKKLKAHWTSLEKLADYMDSNFCAEEEENVWA